MKATGANARAAAYASPANPGLTKLEYFTAEAMKGLLAQSHPHNDPLLGILATTIAVNVLGELENYRS